MTRPALVIGLGGTGQWVLTYLKKDLIESNHGQMPPNVRLLAFDTMPQAGAEVAMAGGKRKGEKEIQVGSVRLKTGEEFVHLGGDVYELEQAVDEGHLPHIGAWFRADNWLPNLPRAAHVLSTGAGQLRQFGRIAMFKDLTSKIESEIWTRLDVAIGTLGENLGAARLEIIIVGSFAGGTGSGLFIDMALLARHRARNVHNVIRGYFVLPRAFDADADDDMLARSFAAWRELNRFMVVSKDFALPTLIYNSQDNDLQLREIKNKVYDACYLVDGMRGAARIATKPELGVFPTIADAVSALLDDTAGTAYTEWVVANLAPTYAQNPGVALYSTVGTQSFKVPVYYTQQEFAHRLTINWLDALLKPKRDPQNPLRITRVDPTSPNPPALTGREEAPIVLTAGQEYAGESEAPTLFLARIADIVAKGGPNNADLVDQYVRGSVGMGKGHGASWLDEFTNLGDRADLQKVRAEVARAAGFRVAQAVKLSKENKVPPLDWPRYVDSTLPPVVRDLYGWRTADGQENRGKFGEALDKCRDADFDIFRRLASLWLMRSLMGGDKSGRLGYAYDLLDGLVEGVLDQFLEFMDRVRQKRQADNPRLRVEGERAKRRAAMEANAGRKFFMFFDHPQVRATQLSYLQAEQAVVNARKDEILHDKVVETVRAIRQFSMDVRGELERWIRMLATGDPATDVEGLYTVLEQDQRDIDKTRHADEGLGAVQTRIEPPAYSQAQNDEELKRLMTGVKWQIDETNGFKLKLSVEPPNEPAMELAQVSGGDHVEQRQHLTQRNLETLQSYTSRRFEQMPGQTQVADRLRQQYATGAAFATAIGNRAEPLFQKQQGVQGGPAKWSELIRISKQGVKETLSFIDDAVRQRRQGRGLNPNVPDQDRLVEAVGSSDEHKCTVVRTDDLMPVDQFQAWRECEAAYLRNREMPPHLNHIFPAEAHAADYELRLAQKQRQQYRVFHPWVVMLLEHPERLEQFVLAWALGWIKLREDGTQAYYEFGLPGYEQRYKRSFMLTAESAAVPSPFQAAKAFVLEGQDKTARSAWKLDYDEIRRALEAAERSISGEAWLEFLKELTVSDNSGAPTEERFVNRWLRYHTYELKALLQDGKALPPGEPADYPQAYTDLVDVIELMIQDRIERKEGRMARLSQTPPPPPPGPLS